MSGSRSSQRESLRTTPMAMSDPHPLTQKIQHSIENPATDDEFDIDREFDAVLADYGFTRSDLGGTVRFDGADPIVASTIRLAGATAIVTFALRELSVGDKIVMSAN